MSKLSEQDKQLLMGSLEYAVNYFNKGWRELKKEPCIDFSIDNRFNYKASLSDEFTKYTISIIGTSHSIKMNIKVVDIETNSDVESLGFSMTIKSLYITRVAVDKFSDAILNHFKKKSNIIPSRFWDNYSAVDFYKEKS